MDLFSNPNPSKHNYLPYDGVVHYFGPVFTMDEAEGYYIDLLETIAWQNDEAIIFGKRIVTKRKVAWYGDEAFNYSYSNTTKKALPWTETLWKLKQIVEKVTGETFNSCLLNLYHDGSEGMAWHSDSEAALKKNGAIGSVSFGGERKFSFKHKQTDEKIDLFLTHGSVLVMKETTQTFWRHRLPPTKLPKRARVNLTFRTIVV